MKNQPHTTRQQQGFTLLEVLLAMGIFVIAFSMVFAMLPASILMQKQTIDELRSRQLIENIKAIAQVNQLYVGDFSSVVDVNEIPSTAIKWSINDRSSPAQLNLEADKVELAGRRFFWVPLYRNGNTPGENDPSKYGLFVFVMRRGEGKTYDPTDAVTGGTPSPWDNGTLTVAYSSEDDTWNEKTIPKVCKMVATRLSDGTGFSIDNDPVIIGIGDWVLDNNGNFYQVIGYGDDDETPDELIIDGVVPNFPNTVDALWFAPPANEGGPSPALKITRIENAFK
jgi:prepilin-type N-terminal cleavage/methylation domain-containing protein